MTQLHTRGRKILLSALLCGVTSITSTAQAGTPEPPGLFSTAPGKLKSALPEQAIAGKSRAVKLSGKKLRSGRFFVSLPDGVSLEAVRDRQYDLGQGRFAWVGHANGDKRDRVVIGVSGDSVAATFSHKGRLFKLEPRANGEHIVSEVSAAAPAPELDPIPVADTAGAGSVAADAPTAADGGTVIDVLVAYTPKMVAIYGAAGADALIIQAVAETNQAYVNSGINIQLNLAQAVLTDYTESGNMNTDLTRLRVFGDGYMDELHFLRDSVGADLVTLVEDEPAYCGVAYRMTSLSSGFAASGFSVVHRTCATGYYSFAHELGHNQGAHHDPANAGSSMYPYAYGHQEPFGAFRTVMAYNCPGGCTRVDHFSNPDVVYSGQPTGILSASDNALTLNNTAATVASFRQAPVANPPGAPSALEASAISQSEIQLSWVDSAADESGFKLERSDNGTDFSEVASLPANTTSYLDNALQAGTLYSYRTRAWSSVGSSDYSNTAVAETESAPTFTEQLATADMPLAGVVNGTYQNTWSDDGSNQTIGERQFGGLAASNSTILGYVEHKWTFQVQPGNAVLLLADVQTSASTDAFTFAYSTDNSTYIDMFSIDNGSASAQVFTLPPTLSGNVYVRVTDTVRNEGETTNHSVKIDQLLIRSEAGEPLPPPDAPSSLDADPAGADRIALTWTDNSDGEYGFAIDRREDGVSAWSSIGSLGSDTTSYLDTGLEAGKVYKYRVSAFNDGGTSPYSNGATAATEETAAAEIGLSASGRKARGKKFADLSWSGAPGATVDIFRNGNLIGGSAKNNSGSYTDSLGRSPGRRYVYQVCEANSSTCSDTVMVKF